MKSTNLAGVAVIILTRHLMSFSLGFFVDMTELDISRWRALPTTNRSEAPMLHDHWIEQLNFSVEVFDDRGNLVEVLARVHDLDAARAAYEACRTKYP